MDTTTRTENRMQLKLTNIAFEGAAIGRDDGRVVFADFGIPGEEVIVDIQSQKRHYWVGSVVEVIEPAATRVTPPCPYFGRCGGCQWQHISYEHQVELKRQVIYDQLRRIGKFEAPPVSPTVPSPQPYGYRNHARFSTDEQGNLGFISRPQDGYRFMRIEKCLIMDPAINEKLAALQGRTGDQHQVMIRYGVHTGEIMIHPDLSDRIDDVETGQPVYHEELLGKRFRISGPSFFQTNTRQAEQLAELVIERLELTGGETIVDAYAGVGTFAVLIAEHAGRVIAIEEAKSALEDAKVNIQGYDNIEYHLGKVEHLLGELDIEPDAVILDPPRSGCHKRTIKGILKFKPPRLIYVSCNPSTLARDLRKLVDGGYTLRDVTPVDMFPQTYHIESVSTLDYTG